MANFCSLQRHRRMKQIGRFIKRQSDQWATDAYGYLLQGGVPAVARQLRERVQAARRVAGPRQRRVQPRARLAQRRQLAVDVLAVSRQARLRLHNTIHRVTIPIHSFILCAGIEYLQCKF